MAHSTELTNTLFVGSMEGYTSTSSSLTSPVVGNNVRYTISLGLGNMRYTKSSLWLYQYCLSRSWVGPT